MVTIEKKQTLIKIDKKAIERNKKALIENCISLNQFIEKSEDLLRTTFSDNEKKELKDTGWLFIEKYLKSIFKFPDADNDFNLRALGIDPIPLKVQCNAKSKFWAKNPSTLKNGKFELPDLDSLPSVTMHYYYAENEKQIEVYNQAKEICEFLNAREHLMYPLKRQGIADAFEIIRFGTESGENIITEKRMFYPKERYILSLK